MKCFLNKEVVIPNPKIFSTPGNVLSLIDFIVVQFSLWYFYLISTSLYSEDNKYGT